MPGVLSKPAVDINTKDSVKKSGGRIKYTKCRRCGKRVTTDEISGDTEVCPECGRNEKTGTYWDTEAKCFKSSSRRM